jgi:hypothetical protein
VTLPPTFPCRSRQQHAETIDGEVPALARLGEKRRLERAIDDIGHDGVWRQRAKIDLERRLTRHAEARGVDEESATGKHAVAVVPIDHLDARREGTCKIIGPRPASIGKQHFGRAGFDQTIDHGARGAACAQHHDWPAPFVPPRRLLDEIGHEAISVGVARVELSLPIEPKRVGGADRARGFVSHIGSLEREELMRQRDIGPDIAVVRKRAHERPRLLGRHGLLRVGPVDPIERKPIAVDHWRARMLDRPTDDARAFHLNPR